MSDLNDDGLVVQPNDVSTGSNAGCETSPGGATSSCASISTAGGAFLGPESPRAQRRRLLQDRDNNAAAAASAGAAPAAAASSSSSLAPQQQQQQHDTGMLAAEGPLSSSYDNNSNSNSNHFNQNHYGRPSSANAHGTRGSAVLLLHEIVAAQPMSALLAAQILQQNCPRPLTVLALQALTAQLLAFSTLAGNEPNAIVSFIRHAQQAQFNPHDMANFVEQYQVQVVMSDQMRMMMVYPPPPTLGGRHDTGAGRGGHSHRHQHRGAATNNSVTEPAEGSENPEHATGSDPSAALDGDGPAAPPPPQPSASRPLNAAAIPFVSVKMQQQQDQDDEHQQAEGQPEHYPTDTDPSAAYNGNAFNAATYGLPDQQQHQQQQAFGQGEFSSTAEPVVRRSAAFRTQFYQMGLSVNEFGGHILQQHTHRMHHHRPFTGQHVTLRADVDELCAETDLPSTAQPAALVGDVLVVTTPPPPSTEAAGGASPSRSDGRPRRGQHAQGDVTPPAPRSRSSTAPKSGGGGGGAKIRIARIYYDPRHPAGGAVHVGRRTDRFPDFKLGGVCGDVPPNVVANLVHALTGMRVSAIDMFRPQHGRAAIWIKHPREEEQAEGYRRAGADGGRAAAIAADALAAFHRARDALHDAVWMGPLAVHAALYVGDAAGRDYISRFLCELRFEGPQFARYPRHLLTVEQWTSERPTHVPLRELYTKHRALLPAESRDAMGSFLLAHYQQQQQEHQQHQQQQLDGDDDDVVEQASNDRPKRHEQTMAWEEVWDPALKQKEDEEERQKQNALPGRAVSMQRQDEVENDPPSSPAAPAAAVRSASGRDLRRAPRLRPRFQPAPASVGVVMSGPSTGSTASGGNNFQPAARSRGGRASLPRGRGCRQSTLDAFFGDSATRSDTAAPAAESGAGGRGGGGYIPRTDIKKLRRELNKDDD